MKTQKIISIFVLMLAFAALISAADITPPAVAIYTSQNNVAGQHNDISYSTTIYAHLYNIDSQSSVSQCQIDWGAGNGWESVSKGTSGSWYIVSHTYSTTGLKTIKYRCMNSDGYWSSVNTQHVSWDSINIQSPVPPAVSIYLSESALIGSHNDLSYGLTVYANLWNNDSSNSINTCQINWGDGITTNPGVGTEDSWYSVSHTYSSYGNKVVNYSCQNSAGTWSTGTTQHHNWDSISLQNLTAPIIAIYSPVANPSYNITSIPLNVGANEAISSWRYNLNNVGNLTFTPNTTITGNEGSNTITVYGLNANGVWASPARTFSINTSIPVIPPTPGTLPVLTIISPVQSGNYSSSVILDASSNQAVSWIYNLNNLGNQSIGSGINVWNNITSGFVNGTNNIIIHGTNANGTSSSSITFNFSSSTIPPAPVADVISPVIVINSPNQSQYNVTTIPLSITATDNVNVSSVWYNINNGANTTYLAPTNLVLADNQTYTLNVFANDTSGNNASVTRTFTINSSLSDMTPPVISNGSFTPTTTNGSSQNGNASFNLDENATVRFNLLFGNGTLISTSSTRNATAGFNSLIFTIPSGLSNGVYSVGLTANDSFGNSNLVPYILGNFTVTNYIAPSNNTNNTVIDDDDTGSSNSLLSASTGSRNLVTNQTVEIIDLGKSKKDYAWLFWLLGLLIFLILLVILFVLLSKSKRKSN